VPEGDTIHRTARALSAAIAGAELTHFDLPRQRPGRAGWPQPGERVAGVEARGKHLLIACSGGLTLHTHMRMGGSWHLYRSGERWRRSRGAVVAHLDTARAEAVCFSAPVVEVLHEADLRRHAVLTALGPDLCLPGADLDEALARLDTLDPATPIGVALLDQTVAAGIGNVYRAEVAWACRVDPFRPVREVGHETRCELFVTAARLLRANLDSPRRTTVPGGLAVYDRAGRACPRCGGTVETRRLGEQTRSVWWCPGCQR
jgi:endonuclease-8